MQNTIDPSYGCVRAQQVPSLTQLPPSWKLEFLYQHTSNPEAESTGHYTLTDRKQAFE